jgi:hypothetical protein
MMNRMFYKLRGIDKWPTTAATVSSTEIVGTGGRAGLTMNVYFDYKAGSSYEAGKLFVDDNSSLYGLAQGEAVLDPVQPKEDFYCAEAQSLSQSIRRGIMIASITFVVVIVVIEFFGNSMR